VGASLEVCEAFYGGGGVKIKRLLDSEEIPSRRYKATRTTLIRF
jgi:hypothetical protein